MPEDQIKEFVTFGTPEDVLRQIELFEQAGIQYLIVDLEPSRELEALDVFANKVMKKARAREGGPTDRVIRES